MISKVLNCLSYDFMTYILCLNYQYSSLFHHFFSSFFFACVNILYFKNLITRNVITTYYLVVLYLTGDYRATLHVSETNSVLGASGQ